MWNKTSKYLMKQNSEKKTIKNCARNNFKKYIVISFCIFAWWNTVIFTCDRTIVWNKRRRQWRRLFTVDALIMNRPTTLLWRGCSRWKLSTSGFLYAIRRTRCVVTQSPKEILRKTIIAVHKKRVHTGYSCRESNYS